MARRSRKHDEPDSELNLAPIMNMVMILIPLLLLSTVFLKTGVVNISSPRNAQATQADEEEREEDTPVPRVVVYISADGFRVGDQRNLPEFQPYTQPIQRCGGAAAGAPAGEQGGQMQPHDMADIPATVCLRDGVDPSAPLIDKLDYAGLYNRLVEVRLKSEWFDRFGEESNGVISILGDPEIPFEVLIATMDAARYVLQDEGETLEYPTAASQPDAYLLAGGNNPSPEDLGSATYILGGEGGREQFELFPDPVLLLPRPSTGG